MKKDSKKNKKNDNISLKPLLFATFLLGSFLSNNFGKVSAVLAGTMLALYALRLFTGWKRYVLAPLLLVIACILIRYASYETYRVMTDDAARDTAAERTCTIAHHAGLFVKDIGHYGSRLMETAKVLWNVISAFRSKPCLQSLAPLAEHPQFLVILAAIALCILVVAFRDCRRRFIK